METWIDTKDLRDQGMVNMWVKIIPFVFSLKNLKNNDSMQKSVLWCCDLCSYKTKCMITIAPYRRGKYNTFGRFLYYM